jgi:hypothetical protein
MRSAAIWAVFAMTIQPPMARADDCEQLRQRLVLEHDRAVHWNVGWGLGLGGLAVAQAFAAPLIGDRIERDTLYVGAVSSAIGALSSVVTPLRVRAPEPGATCTELQQDVIAAGDAERAAFYLNHVGGLVLNTGAGLVLAHYTDAKTGAVAFAVGYAVSLVRTYTAPRWAWHPTITIGPNAGVGIAGTF